jgi:hypothetical protein
VINEEIIKAIKGLGKNCIHDRYNSPPTKAPRENTYPWSYYDWTSLDHTTSYYMA